ncbi:MAG: HEAT repeat domain-containing protein [bacterium]
MNLQKLLKSDNIEKRLQAVESLRDRRDPESLGVLIEAMKDESWRVRKTATDVLQNQFRPDDYINGVLSLLAIDDNAGARNSAIDLLITMGKPAIPYLIEAFRTDNHDVRKFVIDVIGEITDKRALPLLLGALKDADENVKASAVEHLGKLKEPTVVDALIEILRGDDIWTAYPAADALGRICDRKALPALVQALGNKMLREPVLRSLACFSDPETLDHIIPLLVSGSRSVKDEVLRTINAFYRQGVSEAVIADKFRRHLGDRAFDLLMEFVWSTRADVRLSAILLLGILKDSRAVKPLLSMSGEDEFRDEIRRALIFIGRDNPRYILELFGDLTIIQKRFLAGVAAQIQNPAFLDLFCSLLKDEDGHVRALAARGIGGIGDPATARSLMGLMSDPFVDVQEAALEALAALPGGVDRDEVIAGLSDRRPDVRKNAAFLLGKIGDPRSVHAIGFVMKDPDVSVRKAAVQSFSLINDPLLTKYLMVALTDEIPAIRIEAAYALGKVHTPESTDALILLLSDPDELVRVAAAKAIGIHSDEKAADMLIRVLTDENGFVVTAALETLGTIRTGKSRDAIIRMLSSGDDEIRRTAISALAGFSGIVDHVKPFLRDPDWATRRIAVETIGKQAQGPTLSLLEEVYDLEEDPTVKKMIEAVFSARR